MNSKLQYTIFYLGIVLFVSACSEYKKVQKSSDFEYKYAKAVEYFEGKKYFRAYPLIEELTVVYRGTDKAENLSFMNAYTDYYLEDYLLASHRFQQFHKTYPRSPKAEEALFMSAYCHYLISPEYSLDQENTHKAINEMQTFINLYPRSHRIDSCNMLVAEMRDKLEIKAYESAKQYMKMEHYRSATTTFENLLLQFPDTKYREDAYFSMFKANYLLAKKSIENKKLERIDKAIKAYITFVDRFPQSKLIAEAESYFDYLQREKVKLKQSS